MKDLNYYMGLPYTFELKGNRRDGWTGKVLELAGCRDKGNTIKELHDNIKEAMEIWIEEALQAGDPIPEPKEDKSWMEEVDEERQRQQPPRSKWED